MNTQDMNAEAIAKDRETIEAATPGPWEASTAHWPNSNGPDEIRGAGPICEDITYDPIPHSDQAWMDAEFIAAARTRWPAALDEIERLRDNQKKAAELITKWMNEDGDYDDRVWKELEEALK